MNHSAEIAKLQSKLAELRSEAEMRRHASPGPTHGTAASRLITLAALTCQCEEYIARVWVLEAAANANNE